MSKANQKNKYVKVVILHAGVPDYMDKALSEREVREIQANMQNINFDIEHSHNYIDGISIKQNYITRTEETLNNEYTINKGSWVMVLGVSNEEIIREIQEEKIRGVSLETDFTSNMKTKNNSPVIPYKDVITKEEMIPHVISFTANPANRAPLELMTHKQYTQKNNKGGKKMKEEKNMTEEEVNWLRSLVEKFTTKHTSKSVGEIAQSQPTLGSGTDELVASLIESQKVIPTITKSMETIAQSNAKMSEAFGIMSAKLDQVLVQETATENQEQEGETTGGNTIERQEKREEEGEDKLVNEAINEKNETKTKETQPQTQDQGQAENGGLTPEEEKQLEKLQNKKQQNTRKNMNGLHPPVFTPLTEENTTQERAAKEYMAGRTFESLTGRGGN